MELLQVNKIRTQEELESAFAIRKKVFGKNKDAPRAGVGNEDVFIISWL